VEPPVAADTDGALGHTCNSVEFHVGPDVAERRWRLRDVTLTGVFYAVTFMAVVAIVGISTRRGRWHKVLSSPLMNFFYRLVTLTLCYDSVLKTELAWAVVRAW
jgi:hypothetical protein